MGITLGFGETEIGNQIAEMRILMRLIKKVHRPYSWFTEEYVEKIKKVVEERLHRLDNEYEEYAELPKDRVPERYYRVLLWNVTYDVSRIYFEFSFTHINRNHPLSKDGWGAWYQNGIILSIGQDIDTKELVFNYYSEKMTLELEEEKL